MKSDVTKSLNKFFEEYFRLGAAHGIIPSGTNLIFDLYERAESYPKAVLRIKDVDTLDHAWRTTSTVSFKIFVDDSDVELLNELSNYALGVIQNNYTEIPLFHYKKVISDASNPSLQIGEKLVYDKNGDLFLRTKPARKFKNYSPYLDDNLVLYLYDNVTGQEVSELIKDVDFVIDTKTGKIDFIVSVNIQSNIEVRAFYVVREFVKIGKIIPDTILEIPMYVGDSSAHGRLTSEIMFHFIA